MALLVEGLDVGREGAIEEYIIGPATDGETTEKGQVKLYGHEEGMSWVAKPVTGQSNLGIVSRQGSMANQNVPFMDPLVTLFGSVHENIPAMGSMRSMLIPNSGSMFSMIGNQGRNENWDEENARDDEDSAGGNADSDDNLQSPLLSPQESSVEKDAARPVNSSMLSMRRNSSLFNPGDEASTGIGGGWQLAYKYSERTGKDGRKEGGIQRMYLKQEAPVGSQRGSFLSATAAVDHEEAEHVQASALVSQTAIRSRQVLGQIPDVASDIQPPQTADKSPSFGDLFEPGVKRALIVGVSLQMLQQVRYEDYLVSTNLCVGLNYACNPVY